MHIQNYAYENYSKIFSSIYLHLFIYIYIYFVTKLKHYMNIFLFEFDRLMRPLLRQLLDREILQNIMWQPNLKATVHFSEIAYTLSLSDF